MVIQTDENNGTNNVTFGEENKSYRSKNDIVGGKNNMSYDSSKNAVFGEANQQVIWFF